MLVWTQGYWYFGLSSNTTLFCCWDYSSFGHLGDCAVCSCVPLSYSPHCGLTGMFVFVLLLHFILECVLSDTARFSRLILCISCPSPREEKASSWRSLVSFIIKCMRNHGLGTRFAPCYGGGVVSKSSQLTDHRSSFLYTNPRTDIYCKHFCMQLSVSILS